MPTLTTATASVSSVQPTAAEDTVRDRPPPPSIPPTIFAAHLFFVICWATGQAVIAMLPVLARRHFAAGDWQTVLITGAGPTLLTAAIFWHEVLQRMSLVRYFICYWLVGVFPLGLATWVNDFWTLWTLQVIAAIGAAAWSPLSGTLLKRFYADHVRGRVFSILSIVTLSSTMLTAAGIGAWLEHDPQAFRIYMPLACVAHLLGIVALIVVARLHHAVPVARTTAPLATAVIAPLRGMGAILRADSRFRRYEQAFMTYGMGWMICNALVPVLATEKLRLSYQEYANATQVAQNFGMIAMAIPMGWLMDRVGAARTSALAFLGLTIYPIALMLAANVTHLAVGTVAFGMAMAGVQVGWLLGPVSLAPRSDLVPQYVAIHATLVGVRGVIAQGLGMLVYVHTGSFIWPMLVAALAFLWSSQQMWTLRSAIVTPPRKSPRPAEPPADLQEAT